jgi:soluble lytic murein transglycosylase-like protein
MKAITALAAALAVAMTIPVAMAQENTDYSAAYQGKTLIDLLRGRDQPSDKPEKNAAAVAAGVTVTSHISVTGPYGSLISKHAAANGIPLHLASAIVRVESNYRPNARGSAGEIGLMQIKPATARMLGYTGSIKGLFDPETNIRFGMKYLGMAHKLGGGDTCGTVLRYNAGHAARRMNPISSAYCTKVKQFLARR